MIEMDQLKSIEKIVRHAIYSYRTDLRYEDAVQEALIRAWKDIEEGNEEFHHVANRAKLWARSFLGKHYARTTGAPPLSKDGVTTEEAERKRQKIISYVHEFTKLHDRKPTNNEVAQALGMPYATVAQQRINIATGAYDHAIYEAEGTRRRIASTYFKPVYMDAFEAPDKDTLAGGGTFEKQTVAELDFFRMLAHLPLDSRKALYWHVYMGYGVSESAYHCGWSSRQFNLRYARALDEARAYMDPVFAAELAERDIPRCPKGHKKAGDNLLLGRDGVKRCRTCANEVNARKAQKLREKRAQARANRSPRLKSHCKRDHEIRGIRPDGKRYCKVCNYLKNTGKEPDPNSKIWEWDQPK